MLQVLHISPKLPVSSLSRNFFRRELLRASCRALVASKCSNGSSPLQQGITPASAETLKYSQGSRGSLVSPSAGRSIYYASDSTRGKLVEVSQQANAKRESAPQGEQAQL
jgi:hypothetical protein